MTKEISNEELSYLIVNSLAEGEVIETIDQLTRDIIDDYGTLRRDQQITLNFLEKYRPQHKELFEALVWIYNKDTHSAAIVAELCDEVLDRSGGLLGRVREAASVAGDLGR